MCVWVGCVFHTTILLPSSISTPLPPFPVHSPCHSLLLVLLFRPNQTADCHVMSIPFHHSTLFFFSFPFAGSAAAFELTGSHLSEPSSSWRQQSPRKSPLAACLVSLVYVCAMASDVTHHMKLEKITAKNRIRPLWNRGELEFFTGTSCCFNRNIFSNTLWWNTKLTEFYIQVNIYLTIHIK